jgi:NAD(P)H dehydrogenase (quinone)
MTKARIAVSGATGKTGGVVVAELLQAGHPVRALVRREDSRSERLKAKGAEIAVADMSDVERLVEALDDVQGAYFCPPFDPHMIQGAVAFAVAAREARVEHLVSLTQWLASPSHPSLMTRQLWLIDRMFANTPGLTHTLVNPGFFADGYLMPLGLAAHMGVFPWMFGDSRTAPPSNEDIGRVVAAALSDPDRHAGKTYHPTGPALLSGADMAQAVARALRRKVMVLPTPPWLFLKSARLAGLPDDVLSGLRYYIEDHRLGAFEFGAPSDDVRAVTGRAAEDFETIARRYAAAPRLQPTLGNRLRTFAEFMVAPLSPGVDFKRYDRELRIPVPSQPQLAPQSAVWRRQHGGADAGRTSAPGGNVAASAVRRATA